jgi:hypothetical protein
MTGVVLLGDPGSLSLTQSFVSFCRLIREEFLTRIIYISYREQNGKSLRTIAYTQKSLFCTQSGFLFESRKIRSLRSRQIRINETLNVDPG